MLRDKIHRYYDTWAMVMRCRGRPEYSVDPWGKERMKISRGNFDRAPSILGFGEFLWIKESRYSAVGATV